jgi:4-hydroxybenzoate polyprenyltransferase
MRAAVVVQLVIVALLAAVALWWDPGLLAALVVGGGICWAYSAALKRRPAVDVLAMMAWGAAMLLVAFPLDHVVGWCLALQLGLVSGVFESVQVIRDRDEDAKTDVRSTAVVLGVPRTLLLARLLIVASSTYMVLVLHSLIGLLGFVALLYPLREEAVERYWHRIRVTFGFAWLAACVWVYVTGRTAGLFVEASVEARIPLLGPWA